MKDFQGTLQEIKPNQVIGKGTGTVEDFFLVLALIYNDLKGLVSLRMMVDEIYRVPATDEYTAHAGSYAGLEVQFNRLFIGVINEFFDFLNENQSVFSTAEYALVIKKVSNPYKSNWLDIIDTACDSEKNTANGEFVRVLQAIRGNVGYHYYQAGKSLRKGFLKRFFDQPKGLKNEVACYALGDRKEETRFFYADAAVEEYMWTEANRKVLFGNEIENFVNFHAELRRVVSEMNKTIFHMMGGYIMSRLR